MFCLGGIKVGIPGKVRLQAREGGQAGEARLAGRGAAPVSQEAVRPPLRRSRAAPGTFRCCCCTYLVVVVMS